MHKKTIFAVSLVLFMVLITGCTSGLLDNGTDTDSGTGQLALFIADNAVNDLENVYVYIDEVNVQMEGGGWETITNFENEEGQMREVDLLKLRFTEELLGEQTLPAGNYNKIRLKLAADYEDGEYGLDQRYRSRLVYKDSSIEDVPLKVPAGSQKGFQIEYNFNLEEDIVMELVLDVDLTKLVYAGASGKALLNTQAVNVIDTSFKGNITGQVLGESEDNDGQITQVPEIEPNDRDVYVEAYNLEDYDLETQEFKTDAEPQARAVATIEEIDDKPAGSFMLRGLSEGDYKLRAFVGYKIDDEEGVEVDETDYQLKILDEVVAVVAGENQDLQEPIVLKEVILD